MADHEPKIYKNPGVATVLSFFFMGLGQIYNGQIAKGIIFIVLYAISIFLMTLIIGFITTPILWIWGMIDANRSAKQINIQMGAE
jgi:TM2 domain-containing membrane protein YozV